MKKIIKLTESDLHGIIKKSVKKALKEWYKEGDNSEPVFISTSTVDDYNAEKIAETDGYESKDEAAAAWFKGAVESDEDFEEDIMPKYNKFIMEIPELNASMYYDWYAEYYFLVKEAHKDMESPINSFNESVIKEDGVGGGATNCAGAMQTGSGNAPLGSNPESGQYTVPFGKVQRRKIYQPKDRKAGGDVTKQSSNVDMTPAMQRKNGKGGSISIPKR